MAARHDDPADERDPETLITRMKQRLLDMAGGKMVAWESDALPEEEREKFWRDVLTFESGPFATDFERLVNAGVELPAPESIDDASQPRGVRDALEGELLRTRLLIRRVPALQR
jgi:hypothetical protein